MIDRARGTARQATETVQRHAQDVRDEAEHRWRQLGGGTFGR